MAETLLTIRIAEPHDALALSDIYEEAWRLAYQGIIPHIALQQMINKRGPRWWQRSLQTKRNTVLLEFDNDIAGYVCVGRNRQPDLPFSGEIQELYMQPHYQGLGFGKKLFMYAQSMLERRGMDSLVVWALKDNDTACDFYSRRGGKPVAKIDERFGPCRLEKIAFGWGSS